MATIGNNVDREIADLRDSFFDSGEKEYFDKVLKNPEEKNYHRQLLKRDAKRLYNKAYNLITRVENGEFSNKEMLEVERVIAHCLGAIEDLERVNELELTR